MTEPIDQATKDLIEKEAIQYEDKNPHDAVHSAYYMGATVWAEKLKQERNKGD